MKSANTQLEVPDLSPKLLILCVAIGLLGWFCLGLLFQRDVSLLGIPVVSKTFTYWVYTCGLLLTLSLCLFLLSCNRVDNILFRGSSKPSVGWSVGLATVLLSLGLLGTKVWVDKHPSIDNWGGQGFASRSDYKEFLLQYGENHSRRAQGRRIGTEELKRRGLGWDWAPFTIVPLVFYFLMISGSILDGPVRALTRLLARSRISE